MKKSSSRPSKSPRDTVTSYGLLDAYVDAGCGSSGTEAAAVQHQKPVSMKNKNKKKREQREVEQKRQLSESQNVEQDQVEVSQIVEEEVVDSWEDISAADAPPAPQPVQLIVAPVRRHQQATAMSISQSELQLDSAKKALSELQSTVRHIHHLFQLKPEAAPEKTVQSCAPKHPPLEAKVTLEEDKPRDEVLAEREAKKRAKAEAKLLAKQKGSSVQKEKKMPTPGGTQPSVASEQEVQAKEAAVAAGGSDAELQQPAKSKAQLRADRRAKQEAQRSAKAEQKTAACGPAAGGSNDAATTITSASKSSIQVSQTKKKGQRVPDDLQADRLSVVKKREKQLAAQQIPSRTKAQKKVLLFSHLHQYERSDLCVGHWYPLVGAHIHPSVLQLGLQYAKGTVQGSNARCVALMFALKRAILDYETPEQRELSRDLDAKLKLYVSFLKECRPHSVSMGNAIRFIKSKISSIRSGTPDHEAKAFLCDSIDTFVHHNIVLAAEQIGRTVCKRIHDGDVILTYGCSSLLRSVFLQAARSGRHFRVIVADARPKSEGAELVRHLVTAGIHCTYILVTSVSYVIKEVSKVLLSAHAVLANGFVMSRVGTAQVALVAKAYNVPVLVCCETYKFSERLQTDSIVFNELGDPEDLVKTQTASCALASWRDLKHLTLLNLTYDFTPASLVDAIISEISVLPGTSVPVVLRLKKDFSS